MKMYFVLVITLFLVNTINYFGVANAQNVLLCTDFLSIYVSQKELMMFLNLTP